MPLFRRRAENPDELAALRAEVAGMAARLAAADAAAEARAERADRARQSLAQFSKPDAPAATSTPLPAEPPPPIAHAADLEALRDELAAQVAGLAARLDAIDERITAVTTELANQLSELGAESDVPGETVAALREAQTRLANEQARYQIAFRDDLARLAEQIRRH